ncbi:MAG: hypothetical protein ACFFCS_13455 [Candidatus Hodarchaeota archaeon]
MALSAQKIEFMEYSPSKLSIKGGKSKKSILKHVMIDKNTQTINIRDKKVNLTFHVADIMWLQVQFEENKRRALSILFKSGANVEIFTGTSDDMKEMERVRGKIEDFLNIAK